MRDDAPVQARPLIATGLPDETLEEINRLWTIVRAFSNTAHDVNNAIQVIAGNAELLEARELDPAIRKRVEVIRTEATRASTTINRLLSYSRDPRVAAHPIDLRPFVESAVDMRMASASRQRIVLTLQRMEPRPCAAIVEGRIVSQVLLDLLLAAEDRVAGHRNARVIVSLEREADAVVVRVTASSENDATAMREHEGAPTAALTRDLQLWAAAHLAAKQGGTVSVVGRGVGCELTLRLPAVALPA